MKELTFERAKSNLRKFWTAGFYTKDFVFLGQIKGHDSVIGKREFRIALQSTYELDTLEAKSRSKVVFKNLEKYGLGKCKETVEGKQFVFSTVVVSDDVAMVLNAHILFTWVQELQVQASVEQAISKATSVLDKEIETLSVLIEADLTDVAEDDYLTHVHNKYDVMLSVVYGKLPVFSRIVSLKIVEEQIRQKLIVLIGG